MVAAYSVIGLVGGYSMLGASQCVVAAITEVNREAET